MPGMIIARLLAESAAVVVQFECGTRILRVIHGRDPRATSPNCTTTSAAGELFGTDGTLSNEVWPGGGFSCGHG